MLYGCFFIQSIKGKTCLCTEETPKIQFSRRTKSFQKNIFLYLRNIFHVGKQKAFCFENTTYMRFVTFLGHESPAPKHSNPNLLPIGETFGFVVFLKDVK